MTRAASDMSKSTFWFWCEHYLGLGEPALKARQWAAEKARFKRRRIVVAVHPHWNAARRRELAAELRDVLRGPIGRKRRRSVRRALRRGRVAQMARVARREGVDVAALMAAPTRAEAQP